MKYIALLIALAFVAFIIVNIISSIESKKIKISYYNLKDENYACPEMKIMLLADLHNKFQDDLEKLFAIVKKEKPDIVLIAGDMIVSRADQMENSINTAAFISRLADITEVYYGMGNHETKLCNNLDLIWGKYKTKLSDKVKLLKNEHISPEGKSYSVYGLELPEEFYEKFSGKKLTSEMIDELIGKPTDSFNILIAHNPDFFDAYCKWGADLIVSGHNHGGLVRINGIGGLISPKPQLFPKYDKGLFISGNKKMIISSGLGGHSLMYRVNNIPEVVVINL